MCGVCGGGVRVGGKNVLVNGQSVWCAYVYGMHALWCEGVHGVRG